MSFQVKLEMFEGPLDLLLHLIREHQLDILDIPIATITEEYLRTLALMQELDLDVAGEFLLMAATLIHIKSKMLLPPEEAAEGEEATAEEDPRAELVQRLLEYKRYKEAAQTLGLLEAEQARLHARGGPAMELTVEGPLQVSVFELLRAFRDVLQRAKPVSPLEISREELNVGQRIVALVDQLAGESPVEFRRLFPEGATRSEVIVTFLALLEMLRRGLASARQGEPLGPIMVYRGVERVESRAEVAAQGEGSGRESGRAE
ncbi:MAG: segregation/condensation protein A [candidate division NC10 bacterium]|nr:segregation/condensation protein A [candidate division NC10 bacterium]